MAPIYEFLLRLYPSVDRSAFGDEMLDVLREAEADAARRGVLARSWFLVYESMGLLRGAARERLHALGEERGWKFLAERGPMFQRERRYPYTSIVFMSLALAVIVLTIAKAQGFAYYLVQTYTVDGRVVIATRQHWNLGNSLFQWPSHWGLLGSIALFFAITWVAGIAAWGVSHAMRRSGVHRLDEAQTWPQTR
jgi:lysylphosphatidylglycerol synthetase-like protein (DUF2156 family)